MEETHLSLRQVARGRALVDPVMLERLFTSQDGESSLTVRLDGHAFGFRGGRARRRWISLDSIYP